MMVGMYGSEDPGKEAKYTAEHLAILEPDTVRIYPTIVVEADGDTTTKTSRSIVTITYRTKKMRLVVEKIVDGDKLSCFKIDREGYDSRYTTDRDS